MLARASAWAAVRPPASEPDLEIETYRLRLRRWRDGDVAAYARIIRDPEVMRLLGCGARYRAKRALASAAAAVSTIEARQAIARMERHWRAHGFGEWAVEDKATGTLLGAVGLVHHADWVADPADAEVGWLLATHAWGRGFATEAGRASLEHAFGELGLARLVSIARPANERSVRVMQRLGLEYAGRTRWKGGPVVWYALDRAGWQRQIEATRPCPG